MNPHTSSPFQLTAPVMALTTVSEIRRRVAGVLSEREGGFRGEGGEGLTAMEVWVAFGRCGWGVRPQRLREAVDAMVNDGELTREADGTLRLVTQSEVV